MTIGIVPVACLAATSAGAAVGHDHIHRQRRKLGGQRGKRVHLPLGRPDLEAQVAIAERLHLLPERLDVPRMQHTTGEPTDARRLRRPLAQRSIGPEGEGRPDDAQKRATARHAAPVWQHRVYSTPARGSRR